MAGGIISYPRTDADGRGDLERFLDALQALKEGGAQAEQAARELIDALRGFSDNGRDPASTVSLAIDARNALFVALGRGDIVTPRHSEAMLICAKHWKELHKIETTGLAEMLGRAITAAARSVTIKDRRNASEQAGNISLMYQASALLGRDLLADYAKSWSPVPGHRTYLAARDSSGQLRMLECGAAYNVNLYVREDIPGADQPLILTGEGKGGGSGYGTAGVRADKRVELGVSTVRQNSFEYAPSRAHYMMLSGTNMQRRDAGTAIFEALREQRLVSLWVRGAIINGCFETHLEGFVWE